MTTRTLLALLVPEGILLLLVAALIHWFAIDPSPDVAALLRLVPIAVLGVGFLLGWRFQRGRLLLALLGLVLADRAMIWLAPPESDGVMAGPVTVQAVAILLPASLAVLAWLAERGPLSEEGLQRLVVLAGETALVLAISLLAAVYPAGTTSFFGATLMPASVLTWLPVGQPAALAMLLAVVALAGRALWRPTPEARGFLWAAIGGAMAVGAGPAHGRSTLYLTAAGLVLVVATIESAYALAYHDELTGLPGRRALNDALQRATGRYTVAMVDVDHFKKFNDTHGHDVGDQVLRMVAGRLSRVTGGGRAFRYGGEEFAVLFAGRTADESLAHLETLRTAVAGATFALRGKDRPRRKPTAGPGRPASVGALAVTVSIGAAEARGAVTPETVVRAADRALYRAKDAGRNRVAV
jgi:diguanylate cyclase (GGDEF)-like protein